MIGSQHADRTLDVLEAVAALGSASLPAIQARVALPMTTTYRIVCTLVRRGFVLRCGRGAYRLGAAAFALGAASSEREALTAAARLPLIALARRLGQHVHLGIFEDDMVTYLVKQHRGRSHLPSIEGAQLEAYCSALGKILLADLSNDALERYLAEGSLIALTANTIIDPALLRSELAAVRLRGWAVDEEEVADGLRCIAVPLRRRCGAVAAAVSISTNAPAGTRIDLHSLLPHLVGATHEIERQLYPST